MIFLGNLTAINPTKSQVGFIHSDPFSSTDGMGMTQAQLEAAGILVEAIPDPQLPVAQVVSGMFIDPTTKTVFYEYAVPPLTFEQKIADLQSQNAQMLLVLVQGGLM